MWTIIKRILKTPAIIFFRIKGYLITRRKQYKSKKQWLKSEKETKHLTLSVAELFMQENTPEGFNRYDIIVRLLAIECEKGMNDYGWNFYRRMQSIRVGIDDLGERISNFKKLINSYDIEGYDNCSEIEVDSNLHLIDGSHRMAMALYHHLPTINVKVRPYVWDCFYGIEFFKVNGFSEEECYIIQNRYKKVLTTGVNQSFVCTLWHPIRNYFEEITKHLCLFGKVVEIKDFLLSAQSYRFYTKGIYHVDDIADWKIEKKIEYMMPDKTSNYHLRMVVIELYCPNFRLKSATNRTLSQKCEFIKQLIRNAYKSKIDSYFHDIIIHIGDNFYQNQFIYNLMTMPHIDVKSILDNISQYNYVIIKTDVEYMPLDFPEHYPLGKDIDIICANKNEHEKVLASVKRDVEKYSDAYNLRFVEIRDKEGNVYRTLLRFELKDKLVLQLDMAYRIVSLSEAFSVELCEGRIEKNGYYVPDISKELIVRLCEMMEHPEKVHHTEYVKKHFNKLDYACCNKYLTEEIMNLLNRIKTKII